MGWRLPSPSLESVGELDEIDLEALEFERAFKPDVAAASVPRIRIGEIKGIASSLRGIRQLALRGDIPRSALVTYTPDGRVHMQIFRLGRDGVHRVFWKRWIGSVKPPVGERPGSSGFGNKIENPIMKLVAYVTGQRFLSKLPQHHGADLVPRPPRRRSA